jgi:salicylate hydroxylase
VKIAIVGCGPAGLSCALALAQQNHLISIFEKMTDLSMQGSGVIIQPIGLAALDLLGVRQDIEQYGQRLYSVIGRSGEQQRISVSVDYSILTGINYALGLQRGALFNLLYQKVTAAGVNIYTGIAIESLRYEKDHSIILNDQCDESYGPYELVIDASGVHSRLRQYARKTGPVKPLEYGSLWSKVDLDPTISFNPQRMEMYSDKYNVGIGVMPIGKLALTGKPQVALFWNLKWADYPQWRSGDLDEWKIHCIKNWPSTAPFLEKVTHHDQMYLAKFLRHTLPFPYGRNIAFVGDAAHATNPQLGQGINMSLIDAVVLAAVLNRQSDLTVALKQYAKLRKNHIAFYQLMARVLTPFYQSDNTLAIRCRDWLYEPLSSIPMVKKLTAQLIGGHITQPLRQWD